MANYVRNTIWVVEGDPKQVFDAIRTVRSVIDFEQLIPMPDRIKNSNEEVEWQGTKLPAWQAWAAENWGTLKNACDAQYFQSNAIDFDSACCEPMPIIEALAKRFPNHVMVVISDYLDWGVDECEIYVFKNGSVISEGRKQYRYVGEEGDKGETHRAGTHIRVLDGWQNLLARRFELRRESSGQKTTIRSGCL